MSVGEIDTHSDIRQAAAWIADADALLITAGAASCAPARPVTPLGDGARRSIMANTDTTGTLSASQAASRESQGKFVTRLPAKMIVFRPAKMIDAVHTDVPEMPRWLGWR